MTEPVAGIIGGMGPEATVELMRRVIRATPAGDDADHIRMIVDNNPKVPSRIAAILGSGESPAPVLAQMARGLEVAGADFLAMPCNTAHYFLLDIQAAVSIPVLDMIGLTVSRLQDLVPNAQKIGILCTAATRQTGLFEAGCKAIGVSPVFCTDEKEAALLHVIRAVKSGRLDENLRTEHRGCAAQLIDKRVDGIIVACTELSTLGGLENMPMSIIDTLDTLVNEIVTRCR